MSALLCLVASNAVVATLLAVLVVLVTRFWRSPAVRHALWLLVLLKLLTPPLFSLPIELPRSEIPSPPEQAPLIFDDFAAEPEPRDSLEFVPQSNVEPIVPEVETPPAPPVADYGLPLLMALWLGGSLAWWTMAGARLWRFHRLLRLAHPASVAVCEQAAHLAARLRLRRCPPVAFVAAPLSPMLWALGFSPRLLLPAALWPKLSGEQQDTLLAHELAHLRRGDHWIRRLEFIVLGLYWWHPLVWWARRRLQEAEEECCDALVIATLPDAASAYAAAMVETVAFLSETRAAALIGASGAGQVPLLKRRLTMILTENPCRRPSRAVFWIVFGLGVLLLPLAPGAAKPEASEPSQTAEDEPKPDLSNGLSLTLEEPNPRVKTLDSNKFCASCHVTEQWQQRDLQGKTPAWKESHDEVIRLMDQVRRLQAELKQATARSSVAAPDRSEEIEKLKDEIEVLKLKVQLKEAHRRGTQAKLDSTKRRLEVQTRTNRTNPGTIPRDEIEVTQVSIDSLAADIQVEEIEYKEAAVRLQQAERRLARLQRPSASAETKPPEKYDRDLGKISHDSIMKAALDWHNSTGRTLRIASVRSGMDALSVNAEPREIPPGAKALFFVTLDARRFIGAKDFTFYVQFEKEQPELQWRIHAVSVAESVVVPPKANAQMPPAKSNQAHLEELENKVEKMLKEIQELRREMKPQAPESKNKK